MEYDAAAILERMKPEADAQNDTELAQKLGVPRPTLTSWRKRGSVPLEKCLEFADRHLISLQWLLTGDGKKHVSGERPLSINIDILELALSDIDRTRDSLRISNNGIWPPPDARFSDLADYVLGLYQKYDDLVQDAVGGGMTYGDAIKMLRKWAGLSETSQHGGDIVFFRSGGSSDDDSGLQPPATEGSARDVAK
ncbi:MAG: hypothetical protein GC191_13935 [Azospirillum sp.]|nr:hypothetical protein [Azospirillum sp.]